MHPVETVVHLPEVVLIIMALLTVAMLAAGICHNLPIPYTVFLVILGIVLGSIARNEESMHVLLEFQLTPDIVLFLFLPALIFESAFNLNARQLVKDLLPVLVLAVPALLISTAFIAIGLWFGLTGRSGQGWRALLLMYVGVVPGTWMGLNLAGSGFDVELAAFLFALLIGIPYWLCAVLGTLLGVAVHRIRRRPTAHT